MVEVYFNAQSNNGTLTDGESTKLLSANGPRILLFSSQEPHFVLEDPGDEDRMGWNRR